MRRFIALVALVVCNRQVLSAGLSRSALTSLDGGLLIGNAEDDSIAVYPTSKTSWTKSDALWRYKLVKGTDGLKQSFGDKINDVKRVVNRHGQICVLIVAHGPGLALYNMETGKFDFSWHPKHSDGSEYATHSAELLPDGNFAVANPSDHDYGSQILIVSGDNSNPKILDTVTFNGIHGLVWDRDRSLLWAWGGSLKTYKYSDGKLSHETKISNLPDWAHGGHDLAAMDHEDKVVFSSGGGIGIYDINHENFELAFEVGSAKGIDYDHATKQWALCKHDSPSASFRTYQIRNPEKPKWVFSPAEDMSMYKARFFRDKPFSYPAAGSSPTPSPSPSPPTPSPVGCDVAGCFTRCESKYGGNANDGVQDEAYFCAKGCADMSSGYMVSPDKFCDLAAEDRKAACTAFCPSSSQNADKQAMCEYGCGFWDVGPTPSPSPPSPSPNPSPAGTDTLLAGGRLESGDSLVSSNGDAELKLTSRGELVLKYLDSSFWGSGTSGDGVYVTFQASGPKLIIKDGAGATLWDTGKVPGATRAVVTNSCDFQLTDDSGTTLWSLGQSCPSVAV